MLIFANNYMCKMLRILFGIFFFIAPFVCSAQMAHSLCPDIRSVRMELNGVWDAAPVMLLGGDDRLLFSFDEMSHTYRRYFYRITHCNADWTPSDLHPIDYIDGFNDVVVEDWENSHNTTVLYTHYSFTLPNENVALKASGNYKVELFDEEAGDDAPVALFTFAVVDPKVGIMAKVSGNTDVSLNESKQQLSFVVDYSGYSIASPSSDVKAVVVQNSRTDNVVSGIKPTYITADKLEYVYNEALIFDAGNEYRRFEITDPNAPAMNVEEVILQDGEYHALLYVDKPRRAHSNYYDENGRYFVNTVEGWGESIEADYVYAHFAFEAPYRQGGDYFLLGELCGNRFTELSKLEYDAVEGYYHTTQLIKLGVYNYMYVWLPRGSDKALQVHSEGDFYNTENEYLIYIYHRAVGERYDKLVGVQRVGYSLERD